MEETITTNYISSVAKVGDTVIKTYHNTTQEFLDSQVKTLCFLKDKINIPQVFNHWNDGKDSHIVMSYINGYHPSKNSEEFQSALISVNNLSIHTGCYIGNIFSNKITDCFMCDPYLKPVKNFTDLVSCKLDCDIERTKSIDPLVCGILKYYKRKIVSLCPLEDYENVFVHNDINTRNVIVSGDNYFIDWDYAGYYPKIYCDVKNSVYKQDYQCDKINEDHKLLGKLFKQLQGYQAPELSLKSKNSIRRHIIKMLKAICPRCDKELPVSANVCSCGYVGHVDSDED